MICSSFSVGFQLPAHRESTGKTQQSKTARRRTMSAELQRIVEDIKKLEGLAETSFCQRLLAREREVLETEITQEQQATAAAQKKAEEEQAAKEMAEVKATTEAGAPAAPGIAAAGNAVYGKLSKYSWDQSEKFVSIYISWKGIGSLPDGSVQHEFEPSAFKVQIQDQSEGNKELSIPNLCHPIDTIKSKVVTKPDRIVIKLKKQTLGTEWSNLDDAADKKKAERDKRIKSGDLKDADTQQLLADMYANASDEDRRGLMEAAHKGRAKREGREEAKK